MGITAARAARTVSEAISAGESVGAAIAALGGFSLLGFDFLRPETRDQLSDVQAGTTAIKENLGRVVESYTNVAQKLEEEGCNAISI